jgi:hypothetical protein
MTKVPDSDKAHGDRPAFEITDALVEAGVDILVESGQVVDPDARGSLAIVVREILSLRPSPAIAS